MIKQKHKYILKCLLFALISLNSCDVLWEDIIEGCNSYNYPIINSKQLKDGKVDEFYSDYVSAEIKNDPNDDSDYDYYFNISDGLPDGIDWFVEGRKVYFEGTPIDSGLFEFTIELWAEVHQEWWYLEDIPELCTDYSSKEFTMYIDE